jgi:hypothetical protein
MELGEWEASAMGDAVNVLRVVSLRVRSLRKK